MIAYLCLWLILQRKVELELCRQFILRVETVREIDPSDAAVGMYLWHRQTGIVGLLLNHDVIISTVYTWSCLCPIHDHALCASLAS